MRPRGAAEAPDAGGATLPRDGAAARTQRVALVTGASRGIGRAIALALGACGYTVVANWARSARAADALVRDMAERGYTCKSVRANVGSADGIARLVAAVRELGRLDVLVHNAALGSFKPLVETRPNQWAMSMSINAHALLELTRGLSDLLEARAGTVLSLTSQGGRRVIPNYGAVGVSKAALEAVTRYLAAELGPRGIRVNAVCAGWVETDGVKSFPGIAAIRKTVRARTPLRRMGTSDDIADVILLLIRPEARWITGQTVVADGGESLL